HEAQRDLAGGQVGDIVFGSTFGATFTVSNGNRHARTGHAGEEQRIGFLYFDHRHTGFELLAHVAYKVRPVISPRNQFVQVGQHLATVTHTKGKGVFAFKEGFKLAARLFIEQNGFCPAFTGAQYVAVGETAAGHQASEAVQCDSARQNVAHVYVDGGETSAIEGGGHFDLTVHTLLTQN